MRNMKRRYLDTRKILLGPLIRGSMLQDYREIHPADAEQAARFVVLERRGIRDRREESAAARENDAAMYPLGRHFHPPDGYDDLGRSGCNARIISRDCNSDSNNADRENCRSSTARRFCFTSWRKIREYRSCCTTR